MSAGQRDSRGKALVEEGAGFLIEGFDRVVRQLEKRGGVEVEMKEWDEGRPSRWNTLRASRVLRWYAEGD